MEIRFNNRGIPKKSDMDKVGSELGLEKFKNQNFSSIFAVGAGPAGNFAGLLAEQSMIENKVALYHAVDAVGKEFNQIRDELIRVNKERDLSMQDSTDVWLQHLTNMIPKHLQRINEAINSTEQRSNFVRFARVVDEMSDAYTALFKMSRRFSEEVMGYDKFDMHGSLGKIAANLSFAQEFVTEELANYKSIKPHLDKLQAKQNKIADLEKQIEKLKGIEYSEKNELIGNLKMQIGQLEAQREAISASMRAKQAEVDSVVGPLGKVASKYDYITGGYNGELAEFVSNPLMVIEKGELFYEMLMSLNVKINMNKITFKDEKERQKVIGYVEGMLDEKNRTNFLIKIGEAKELSSRLVEIDEQVAGARNSLALESNTIRGRDEQILEIRKEIREIAVSIEATKNEIVKSIDQAYGISVKFEGFAIVGEGSGLKKAIREN